VDHEILSQTESSTCRSSTFFSRLQSNNFTAWGITMAAIGSLIFCTDCGNLLPASKGSEKNILHCECCGAENKGVYTAPVGNEADEQTLAEATPAWQMLKQTK
jgi:hypothetical protein